MNDKKRYTFFFWLAIAIILILNLLLWIYLNQVESKFASNLKERLIVESRSLSRMTNDEYLSMVIPGEVNSLEYISILQTLEDIRRQDSLQSIFILDPDGKILVSSPEIINIQSASIHSNNRLYAQAMDGNFVTSDIQQVENERFMSAYGPVYDIFGVIIGVIIVEAKATYFSTIENLRTQLLIFSISNLLIIILIAFFLFRMIDKTIRLQASAKDQEHLAQLGTMGASVAHEIRNPLGIIEGSNELIRKKYGKMDDEIFNYIPSETKRLSNIIDSFLTFARSPKINKKIFSMDDLISRLKIGTKNEKNVTIVFPRIDKELSVYTDENLLEQAILNILLNAIEAAIDNTVITMGIHETSTKISISVHNNGPAITPESMKKIFIPFFTTKEQGTGLGLAIAKRTIEILNGTIIAESSPDEGTTFIINLPKG